MWCAFVSVLYCGFGQDEHYMGLVWARARWGPEALELLVLLQLFVAEAPACIRGFCILKGQTWAASHKALATLQQY